MPDNPANPKEVARAPWDIQQSKQDGLANGMAAFGLGHKLSDNPYDRSALEWHSWREGWMLEFEDQAND